MDRHRARRALERDLARLRTEPPARPQQGWVRALRDALGMSTRDLARRLGASPSWVTQIEQHEVSGSLTLASLERAAAALGCRLEYALVPERPLEELVQEQARRKAARLVASVAHTMALERQATDAEALDREVEALASRLVDARGLWGEE